MKTIQRLLLAAITIASIAAPNLAAQDTPAVDLVKDPSAPKTPLINDVDKDESLGDWKAMFEKRLVDNQKYASQLKTAIDSKDIQTFRSTVEEVAGRLSVESHIRKQLINIAANVRDPKDTAPEDSKSKEQTSISVDEAKSRVSDIAGQLSFTPRFEAEPPANFALPTPVGEIEIKQYATYRMAKTASDKGSAFLRLFNHIQKNEIEMTSPVQMQYARSDGEFEETQMAFLYPDQQTGKVGSSGEVGVVDVEPTTVISMGMRGRPNADDIEKASVKLREASLHFASMFELDGDVRVLGYNGPSVPAADQFFEVQIELLTKKDRLEKKIQ